MSHACSAVTRLLTAITLAGASVVHAQQTPADQLRTAILDAQAAGDADAVTTAIARFTLASDIPLQLSLDPERAPLPTQFADLPRPPALSDTDWRALQAMRLDPATLDSETATLQFDVIDLDDDGLRDLVVHTYIGGTGLFSSVNLLRQDPHHGFPSLQTDSDAPIRDASVQMTFSINGRGASQALDLLRIDGQVIALYRNSVYGEDLLTLQAPFAPAGQAQALRVQFGYAHEAMPPGVLHDLPAPASLRVAVNEALQRRAWQPPAPDTSQACPTLAGSDNAWPWHGAGHYTFEYAWSAPVQHRGTCLSATVVHFLNSYLGEQTNCCALWLFDQDGEQQGEFALSTRRRVQSVERVPADVSAALTPRHCALTHTGHSDASTRQWRPAAVPRKLRGHAASQRAARWMPRIAQCECPDRRADAVVDGVAG